VNLDFLMVSLRREEKKALPMQKSIVEILRQRADDQSENKAFTFLNDSGQESDSCTYGELDRKIKIIAAFLQSVAKKNDRALLFFQPGLDYIVNFFGCLYAGVTAVPSYPPKIRRNDLRLETMIRDCGASLVLTNESILTKMTPVFDDKPDFKKMLWVDAASIAGRDGEAYRPISIDRSDTAYLQYTSGSTSSPRGAIITHGNLISNSSAIHDNFGHSGKSSGVIWLPPYHDMGLIGGIIQPVFGGFPAALMSPFTFLQKPFSWLKAVSDYRATTSGGPNFAYDLCVQKITEEEKGALDLSAWEVAFNGAEPIRRERLRESLRRSRRAASKKKRFIPVMDWRKRPCSSPARPRRLSMRPSRSTRTN
jgi:acyl-CoA synthetase (AMP-forming)/AMP-acid ligase II